MLNFETLSARLLSAVNGELGWNATPEPDSKVIQFRAEPGYVIWLSVDVADPEYVQLHTGFNLSRFAGQRHTALELRRPDVREQLIAAAHRLTRNFKVVKIAVDLDADAVMFSAEVVAAGPGRMPTTELLASILPRLSRTLYAAVRDFREEVVLLTHTTEELSDLPGWDT